MRPGKAAMQDPRMAPGKAPEEAPEAMEKTMPEYPMDTNELIYPGEGKPFSSVKPGQARSDASNHDRPASHPAEPPTEVPRDKVHLSPIEVKALMEECARCIAACEKCEKHCRKQAGAPKFDHCIVTSRACADICALLRGYLGSAHMPEVALMAKDLAPVCARVCENCALACGHHPDMEECMACEKACVSCAAACRHFVYS